jgi:L-ascorbate metabolism protein UlaG (beta-lactamase superfamily)
LLKKEVSDLAREYTTPTQQSNGNHTRPYAGTLFVCPLNVAPLLRELGVSASRIVELDWWEGFSPGSNALHGIVTVDPHASRGNIVHAPHSHYADEDNDLVKIPQLSMPRIICTPAQHQSARTPFDRNKSLWCSYTVIVPSSTSSSGDVRFFFSGDTGYKSVPRNVPLYSKAERGLPVCPIFRNVGNRYGPFDLATIPIGAYAPRWFMSTFHSSPEDAIDMHIDLKSKRSIGMHWGVFPLTDEPVEEPVARLVASRELAGLPEDTFITAKPGAIISASEPVAVENVAQVERKQIEVWLAKAKEQQLKDFAPSFNTEKNATV